MLQEIIKKSKNNTAVYVNRTSVTRSAFAVKILKRFSDFPNGQYRNGGVYSIVSPYTLFLRGLPSV